jgi:hypothetical protein
MPSDDATLIRSGPPPTFHRRRLPRTRPPFTPVVALFGAPFASVFETKRRLATSATANRRTSTQPGLSFPRRDEGRNLLPFLTCHAAALASPVDTRRAAQRPLETVSVPVPPACAGLPDRDTSSTAPPPPDLRRKERSDDRRARAFGPSEGRVTHPRKASGRSWRVRALGARRRRSPPRRPKSIRCRRRDRSQGMRPSRPSRTDQDSRSYDAPRRAPPSGESGCLPPPRRQARERIAPSGFLRRPPAHAAHTFSLLGRGAFRGALQAPGAGRTLRRTSRERTPLQPAG